MVGTIRRPVQGADTSNTPPPPSYQAATTPTASSSSSGNQGHINAGAFQRNPSTSSTNTSTRHSVAVPPGNAYPSRPLSQAQSTQRPQSYAQPPGAPPGHGSYNNNQQQFQQPPGPPPPQQQQQSSSNSSLTRSNAQEDRLAVCTYAFVLPVIVRTLPWHEPSDVRISLLHWLIVRRYDVCHLIIATFLRRSD